MADTKTHRWRVSLHEAGHGVSAIVFGGQCEGLALFEDGSGICQNADIFGAREAYSIAAGPAAEVLASRFPVPEVAVSVNVVTVDDLLTMPLFKTAPLIACQMARTADKRKSFDSDDKCLALWAITDFEHIPDRWTSRVALAKRIAGDIVERNADAIVRVATALFASGSLYREEITALITPQPNEGNPI